MLFPFVPVIAIILGRLSAARAAISRAKISMSHIIGVSDALARCAVQCGFGSACGTPGESTSAEKSDQSALVKSARLMPSLAARSRAALRSSHACTRAPPAASDFAAVSPVRPRPNTATSCPLNVAALIIILPQFQCREPNKSKNDRNDPKTNNNGGFGPAFFLKMVMNWGHTKDAFPRQFKRGNLNNHRDRF